MASRPTPYYRSSREPKKARDGAQVAMENPMRQLVGCRLTSVIFVLDYLIIGFEGPRALSLLLWPKITKGGRDLVVGMVEYRDALCSFIGETVTEATISSTELEIYFGGGAFRVAMDVHTASGERVIMTGPNNYLAVW
jgi:hypothetical protein